MADTAAVLFTDVEASTQLRTRLGDEEANRVLGECERTVREAVESHGGEVVKQLGDGVMAWFASARSAVLAALEVRSRTAPDGPRVRVGVHAGEVAREGGDLQGAAVHAAARIMASAAGGQVLMSERVRELAGLLPEGTRLVDRGLFWLKGFPERWRLFEPLAGDSGDAGDGDADYVGRDEELADLRRAVDAADGGAGSLVLIGGEPGVGKTRLAEETAAFARRRGMLVFTGRCSDTEGAPPYLPFVEIVEGLARFVPAEAFRSALGDAAPDVARVVPEVRRLFPDLPPPVELPAEQERRYLLNAMRDVIARAARMHSMVLVLDDLHWADEPSLLLLAHLTESLGELPCVVIGTYRDVELEVGRPLARTLEALLRRKLATRVSLRRLPRAAVRALVASLAGQDPPERLVDLVFSETEGNPFFVEEVYRHLDEEGRLFDAEGRFRPELEISEVDVPESVRLVIGRRLDRLSEATREALAAGAVVGREFPFALLGAISGRAEDELLDAVDEAERAKLLLPAAGPEERYVFSHELVRQTLLAAVTSSRRRRLHLRAADAIESVYAHAARERAGDLAYHLLAAGAAADPTRTVRWLRIAADRALDAAAFEDATRHLEAALSLEIALDERAAAEIRFALGRAQRGAGRWEEALATWTDALQRFDALDDLEALGRVAWEVAYQLLWAGRQEEVVLILGSALSRLQGTTMPEHARLLAAAGVGFASSGYLEGALQMIEEAQALGEALGDAALRRDMEQALCFVHSAHPGLAVAMEHGARAAEEMEAASALFDLANVSSFLAVALSYAGRDDEMRVEAARAEALATRFGHVGALIYVSRARDPVDLQESGDIAGFVERMLREIEVGREAGVEWADASARWHVAIGRLWLGDLDEAGAEMERARPLNVPGSFAGWGRGVGVTLSAHAGERQEVLHVLEREAGDLPSPGARASQGAWALLLHLAEALAFIGAWDRLADLRPAVDWVESTGLGRRFVDGRLVEAVRGLAAAATGDGQAAASWFASARERADRQPLRIEGAEVRRLEALALARLGADPSRIASLRAEAHDRYEALGMPYHAKLVAD